MKTHSVRPEPVEGLSFFWSREEEGFDRLSPNGRRDSEQANPTLAPLGAPALDDSGDHRLFLAGLFPQMREHRIGRGRAAVALEIVERDPDRDRDALAAHDALAVAKRRDDVEEPARAFRHRRLHERLVAVVVEAHGDDRAALRKHALGQIRRALGDQTERNAVFAALLGDPLEDLAHRLAGRGLVRRDVAVRLLAAWEDRPLALASRPDRVIEDEARDYRDDDGDDVGWHARDVDDRDRAALGGQAEDLGHERSH